MSNVINFEEFRKSRRKTEPVTQTLLTIPADFLDRECDAAAQKGCDTAEEFSDVLGVTMSAQQVAIGALSLAVCELGKAATLEVIDEILEWYSVQEDDCDDAG